jgi:hypothetical protein
MALDFRFHIRDRRHAHDADRRVVTGHDKDGKAVVLFGGPAPHIRQRKAGGNVRCISCSAPRRGTAQIVTSERQEASSP